MALSRKHHKFGFGYVQSEARLRDPIGQVIGKPLVEWTGDPDIRESIKDTGMRTVSKALDRSKNTAATFAFRLRSLCQSVVAEIIASWVELNGRIPN